MIVLKYVNVRSKALIIQTYLSILFKYLCIWYAAIVVARYPNQHRKIAIKCDIQFKLSSFLNIYFVLN